MMFVICNDAFGYTHEQVLDSSFVTLLAMLKEKSHLSKSRRMKLDTEEHTDEEETVEMTDFDTGKRIYNRKNEKHGYSKRNAQKKRHPMYLSTV